MPIRRAPVRLRPGLLLLGLSCVGPIKAGQTVSPPASPAPAKAGTEPSTGPTLPDLEALRSHDRALVQALEVEGWKREGGQRHFGGAELYGHINGGAELFLEAGFSNLLVQRYKSGTSSLSLELYQLNDPLAAASLYLLKAGGETPVEGLSLRHTFSKYQLMGLQHNYLIIINNQRGDPEGEAGLKAFARAVSPKLPPASPIPLVEALPSAGLIAGSARLLRGPLALQTLITLGEGNPLGLGGPLVAVSGGYSGPQDSRTERVLVDYPSPKGAQDALTRLATGLDTGLTVIRQAAGELVFKDGAERYGQVRVLGARLELLLNLPVAPAPPTSSPAPG